MDTTHTDANVTLIELEEIDHDARHKPYYKADVLKWGISEPATQFPGIFVDPDSGRLQELIARPPDSRGSASQACRPMSSFSLGFGAHQNIPVFTGSSGIERSFVTEWTIERRQLQLHDAVFGFLHAVPVGIGEPAPGLDEQFAKLAIDTGSTATWIFGSKNPRLIQNNISNHQDTFNRPPRSALYSSNATLLPGSTTALNYADGCSVEVDHHRGPFFLRAGKHPSEPSYRVCRCPNFRFGVAMAASDHFETRKMDGILGLAITEAHNEDMENFVFRLHQADLIDRDRFTIALGEKKREQASYLIIGDNTDSTQTIGMTGMWTRWLDVVATGPHWKLHLKSLSIDGHTIKIAQSAILDTGTAYSYLPGDVCTLLNQVLRGEVKIGDPMMVYPRHQPTDKVITLEFDQNLSLDLSFSKMLDPRPNSRQSTGKSSESSAYGAFKPVGTITEMLGAPGYRCCILGNFFLRGMIVEFERTASEGTGGRIRFANRKSNC
ncbi:aspartic peptidase domain-containing protein [Mycena belliarum]|uniref:Aspartic peptidase domain-containing protein n=1 Tax=Mycena belliarum TaxID=1033014 RepID=A0AAD6U1I7_9AGAR|nr:aspartic peptidase domain-containing protein [Mycena belliae]